MPVVYMDHPLIKHKITMLRMDSTKTYEFRKIVEEIAMLIGSRRPSYGRFTDKIPF